MDRIETATCQDCGWTGPVEDTKELRNVWDRVQPGDVMPAGDCPEEGCGGAAMLNPRELATGPRMLPVCDTCGRTDVRVYAQACWNVDTQCWKLHNTYDAAAICAHCDVECSFTMKPLIEAA